MVSDSRMTLGPPSSSKVSIHSPAIGVCAKAAELRSAARMANAKRDVMWPPGPPLRRSGTGLPGIGAYDRSDDAIGFRQDEQLARGIDGQLRVGAAVARDERPAGQMSRLAAAVVIRALGNREHRVVRRAIPANRDFVHRRQRL